MKFIRNRIGTLTAAAILCLSTGLENPGDDRVCYRISSE